MGQYFLATSHHGFQQANDGASFAPTDTGKVTSWLSLGASTPVASEWETITNLLVGSNPMTQSDADRKAAVAAAANGLPVATLDGTDMYPWALVATNNQTSAWGLWIWFKLPSVSGVQRIFTVTTVSGASVNRLQFYANGASLVCEIYVTDSTGRSGTASSVLSTDTWYAGYVDYDSSRTGDDKLRMYLNTTSLSLTYANIGTGDAMTTLRSATGTAVIAARNDSDTPTQALANGSQLGPHMFTLSATLTTAEIAAMYAFDKPT